MSLKNRAIIQDVLLQATFETNDRIVEEAPRKDAILNAIEVNTGIAREIMSNINKLASDPRLDELLKKEEGFSVGSIYSLLDKEEPKDKVKDMLESLIEILKELK